MRKRLLAAVLAIAGFGAAWAFLWARGTHIAEVDPYEFPHGPDPRTLPKRWA